MEQPSISVIIPVYNVESYLPQCLDSLLAQSYSNFEMILVDDGSPDSSGKICDEYAAKDPRIKVIHQENQGVSTARNNGIDIATGKWITFVDSDDWVDTSFLENFQINKNTFADVVFQGLKYVDHNSGRTKRKKQFSDNTIVIPDIAGELAKQDILSFGVSVCKCYKTSIIRQYNILFNASISFHEDHIFTFKYLASCHTLVTTSHCCYNYRCGHNPESLSKKRHPYQNQMMAGQEMMRELNSIRQTFRLPEDYYKQIATFCLSTKIDAASSLFRQRKPWKETKKTMVQILSPLYEFAQYYYPSDKRYSVIRFFAHDTSGILLFIFFLLYTRISSL